MTRVELAGVLGRIPDEWQLLFELLTRISEAIGLTWALELGDLIAMLDRFDGMGCLVSLGRLADFPLPDLSGKPQTPGKRRPCQLVLESLKLRS